MRLSLSLCGLGLVVLLASACASPLLPSPAPGAVASSPSGRSSTPAIVRAGVRLYDGRTGDLLGGQAVAFVASEATYPAVTNAVGSAFVAVWLTNATVRVTATREGFCDLDAIIATATAEPVRTVFLRRRGDVCEVPLY